MQSVKFSPPTFHSSKIENNDTQKVFTLNKKVEIVAITVIAAFVAWILAGPVVSILTAGIVFLSLWTYNMMKVTKTFEQPNIAINHPIDSIQATELTNIAINHPIDSIQATELTNQTFYETMLQPYLARAFADPDLRFISNKSNLLPKWIATEFKNNPNSITKKNIDFLCSTSSELNKGIFIAIRGDGDCTFRSFGAGLFLQAEKKQGLAFAGLIQQFKRIQESFQKNANKIDRLIVEIEDNIALLEKNAKTDKEKLQKSPHLYRMKDDRLNEKGIELKASVDDKINQAETQRKILDSIKNPENRKKIQRQIEELKNAGEELQRKCSSRKNSGSTIEMIGNDKVFDRALIVYLRKAAALNIIFNMDKIGNYLETTKLVEAVLLGELSEFDLLIQRADALAPHDANLQGSVLEAFSLALLFEQPVKWYRTENHVLNLQIQSFGPENLQSKKPLYILNRPGHSDLIVI
jgi:hypothetical protein